MNVENLDWTSIGSSGLILYDKQPGKFRPVVDKMRAVLEKDLQLLRPNQWFFIFFVARSAASLPVKMEIGSPEGLYVH